MTWLWWSMSILIAVIAFYLVYVWLEARQMIRDTPRTPMFTCDKHGVFPAKWALKTDLLPIGEEKEGYKVCPMCLEDAEKLAKQRMGLKV
jgi:hypothetical protein